MHSFQRLYRFQRCRFKLNHSFAYFIHNMYQIAALEIQFSSVNLMNVINACDLAIDRPKWNKSNVDRFTQYVSTLYWLCVFALKLVLLLLASSINLSNPNTYFDLIRLSSFCASFLSTMIYDETKRNISQTEYRSMYDDHWALLLF